MTELHFYQVDVVNDVLDRAGQFYIVRGLHTVDAASYVTTANNTFVHGTGDNAIWDNTVDGGQPLHTAANNLFFGYLQPILPRSFPVTEVRNLAPAVSPFVDAASFDYHFAAGVSAIDFASPTWAPPIDHDGAPRPNDGDGDGSAIADVGAFER